MTRRMVISADAIPGRGGQGVNLRHMCQLVEQAFDLSILDAQAVRIPRAVGILPRVPLVRRARGTIRFLQDIAFDRAAARALPPADIVQGATGQALRTLMTARHRGARTVLDVVTLHADVLVRVMRETCRRWGVRAPLGRRWQLRARAEYEAADVIRVMSDVARATMIEGGVPAGRVTVVPPHLDAVEFNGTRRESDTLRVIFVGLLEPWKGFDLLIDAFTRLNLPKATLRLFGGSSSRPVARYLATTLPRHPTVTLASVDNWQHGYMSVYGQADVLVLPSWADGFGLVVAEAMACGTTVIVSTAAGAADLVEDGVNGFVMTPGDRDGLADRLSLLARDRARCRAMGVAARRTALTLTLDAARARWLPALA